MQTRLMSIRKIFKENLPISIILTAFFLAVLTLSFLDPTLLWDENAYLGNARNYASHSNYTEDFRFPLLSFLIAGLWAFTGESVLAAKLLIMAFGTLSILVFYLISRFHFDQKKSIIATLLFSFNYLVLNWSFRVHTDVPGMFFVILSFYFILKETRRKYIFLSGVFGAVSFLMRFPFGMFLLSAAIYMAYKKQFFNLSIFVLGITIVIMPWLSYNYFNYNGDTIYDLRNQFNIVQQNTQPEPLYNHLINLLIAMNIFAVLLPLGVYNQLKNRAKHKSLIFVYLAISFAYLLFFTNLKLDRYLIPVLPFLYILAFESLKNKKILYLFSFSSLVISVVIISLLLSPNIYCGYEGPLQQSIEYICDKKPGAIASNFWPYFGYACNSNVSSFWTDDLNLIIEGQTPEYIVYSPVYGGFFNKTKIDSNKKLTQEKIIHGRCGESVFIYKVDSKRIGAMEGG